MGIATEQVILGTAGIVALLISLMDLDKDIYVPRRPPFAVVFWWGTFVLANVALAVVVASALSGREEIRTLNPLVGGMILGLAYLALIRAKVYTIQTANGPIEVGLEAVYNRMRGFFYGRILSAILPARAAEIRKYIEGKALQELALEARLRITNNPDTTADVKAVELKWVLDLMNDAVAPDDQKRQWLANFILSGQRWT